MTPADLPLGGRTVLVLRAPDRARPLADRLRALGARVVVAPATSTSPPESTADLDAAVAALGTYDWVAVTSVNAVDALVTAAARAGVPLAGRAWGTGSERASDIDSRNQTHVPISDARSDRGARAERAGLAPRWAAVGPATARALRDADLPVALEARGTAADLVAAFARTGAWVASASDRASEIDSRNQTHVPISDARSDHEAAASAPAPRVLLPLGDLARTVLADGLRAAGWDVDTVVAYRTVPVALPDDVVAAARAGRIDVAVVAAGSAARELARQLGDAAPDVVAIGGPSAEVARAVGLTVVGVADHPTDEALADALCAAVVTTVKE